MACLMIGSAGLVNAVPVLLTGMSSKQNGVGSARSKSVRRRFHTCRPVYRGFARIAATVRSVHAAPVRCGFRPGSAADGHGTPASFNARVIRAALCPASPPNGASGATDSIVPVASLRGRERCSGVSAGGSSPTSHCRRDGTSSA